MESPDREELSVSEESLAVVCEVKESVNTSSLSLLSLSDIMEG